jgi:hypothetical protein
LAVLDSLLHFNISRTPKGAGKPSINLHYALIPILSLRWNVSRRRSCPFAKEKPLHLLSDELLSFLSGGSQAILVDEHPQIVQPAIPGFLRDMVVYPLAQFTAPWGLLETGKLTAELHTFHRSL